MAMSNVLIGILTEVANTVFQGLGGEMTASTSTPAQSDPQRVTEYTRMQCAEGILNLSVHLDPDLRDHIIRGILYRYPDFVETVTY